MESTSRASGPAAESLMRLRLWTIALASRRPSAGLSAAIEVRKARLARRLVAARRSKHSSGGSPPRLSFYWLLPRLLRRFFRSFPLLCFFHLQNLEPRLRGPWRTAPGRPSRPGVSRRHRLDLEPGLEPALRSRLSPSSFPASLPSPGASSP